MTIMLKTSWGKEVSQGCMTNSSSSRVLDFKGVEVVALEDKVHKSEVKTRDDGENVVGSEGTKKMLLRALPAVLGYSGWGGFGAKNGVQQHRASPGKCGGQQNGQARRRNRPEVAPEVEDKIADASMASALKIRIFFTVGACIARANVKKKFKSALQ
ncbi:hypothetical protein L3X38_029553 [Prunus dulcis]|uniref:Uncharacterized protein n=1 Tax=Prunus dulcis TaxID=3755 RepID=A0AAD4VRU5_PRUDU|nr:hypothetical protein L3X38_029553 [Prunus dulcis]